MGFKCRLKVRMLSHSRLSAGKMFQVDGAATEKVQQASSVCMRGTTSIGASKGCRARGGAWVSTSSLRYVGVAVTATPTYLAVVCSLYTTTSKYCVIAATLQLCCSCSWWVYTQQANSNAKL